MEILREATPIARKEHRCDFCGDIISVGEKYNRQTNIYDGSIYDWVSHCECSQLASELDMYDDCDEGLDGDGFVDSLNQYVYDNHYDDKIDDIAKDWQLSRHELVRKILDELKKGEIAMTEELVTLETAKMLREKGFQQRKYLINVSTLHHCYKYLSVPPQSVAQKWLRETKNLHIEIYRNACGYGYTIVKANNGTWMEDDDSKGPNDGGKWDTYEEALEAGLQEALKLI